MKPTFNDEQALYSSASIVDEAGGAPLIVADRSAVSLEPLKAQDRMDLMLSAIKWIFIFLPGAAAMHWCLMMLSLSIISGIWPDDTWYQAGAAMMIFSFMVLMGLGRLSDIRYLKVIAAILSSGIMSAVVVNIAAIFFGYKSFGLAMFLTLPMTILFAHLMKTRIDNEEIG